MATAGVPILVAAASIMISSGAAARTVPTVTVNPGYGPPLTIIKVTGHAFCATCGPVTISVSSLAVDRATVRPDGSFSKLIRVPGSARPGPAMVGAAQNGARPALATFTVTVDQPAPTTYPAPASIPPPGNLPPPRTSHNTGAPSSPTRHPTSSAHPRPSSDAPATSAPSSLPPLTPSSSPAAAHPSSDGSSWPLALAVAGAVVLAAAAGWLFRRRRLRT